jgi:hypothetical protein
MVLGSASVHSSRRGALVQRGGPAIPPEWGVSRSAGGSDRAEIATGREMTGPEW